MIKNPIVLCYNAFMTAETFREILRRKAVRNRFRVVMSSGEKL